MFEDYSTTEFDLEPRVVNSLDALPDLTDWDMWYPDCRHSLFRMIEFTSVLLCQVDRGAPVDASILEAYRFSGRG